MRKILILMAALLLLGSLSARAQEFEGLDMQSYDVVSVHPIGPRAIVGTIAFEMNNSGDRREVRNIRAVVYRDTMAFLQGVCEDLVFERGTHPYRTKGKIKLAKGVNLFEAIGAMMHFDPSLYTVSMSAEMTREDGTKSVVMRKGVALTHFMHDK